MFTLREGKYQIPNFGKLDTSKEVSDDAKLALYINKDFPFIGITKKAVKFLKAQKLDVKTIASLMLRANSVEEVEILLEVKTNKTLKNIAETRIEALK